jgi:hypothetical protein
MASNTQFRNFVTIDDSANVDSFARLRVSNPVTVFDTQHQYNTSPLLWLTSLTGGASITHLPNESSIALTCGTASGDKVIRQSKRYLRYQPGKSQLILNTGIMGAAKTNVRKRIGYFDNSNGVFFEQTTDGVYIVRRTNVTGTPSDNRVLQTAWNIDKMNGYGVSGFTLNITKSQIYIIDAQWLGVGRCRTGFDIDGSIFYVHEFYNANNLDKVYTSTFNLPLRYEIENTGVAASPTTLKQICSAVIAEGGFDEERGITHANGTGITGTSVSTRRPVLSVRPKITFNSIVNRGDVTIDNYSIFSNGNIYYELILNGTLTNSTFAIDGGTNSIAEFDIAATAISGGEKLDSGFLAGANATRGSIAETPKSKYTLSNNLVGDGTDIITLVATSLSGTNSINAEIRVKEIY